MIRYFFRLRQLILLPINVNLFSEVFVMKSVHCNFLNSIGKANQFKKIKSQFSVNRSVMLLLL